ncbi:MAG: T9SS type A sorting domain-containing protein, partial [Desulfocucumaceae bacterium]
DIDGWSQGNQYWERPFTHHAFRYSISWLGNAKLVFDRICVEDTFGRGVRTMDADIYASLDRMINSTNNGYDGTYGGTYIVDEIRAYSYGTYNRLNKYFKDALGGTNYSTMVWRNYPYLCEKNGFTSGDTSVYKVHSYRYFLNANSDSAYCPNLVTHIMPFDTRWTDSLHNTGGNNEDEYQYNIRKIADQLRSARSVCKSYQRNLINNVQAYDWVQTGESGGSRFPTCEEIKVQIYEALCYGAKGIAYEYWGSDSTGDYIERGLKQYDPARGGWYCTPQMFAADTAHKFIKKIGSILKRSSNDDIYSIDNLYPGNEIEYPNGIINSVKAVSSTLYADIGFFTENADKYFMVVNRRTTNCSTVKDTSRVVVKFDYPYPFKLKHITPDVDTLCNCNYTWGTGKVFPSRDTTSYLTLLLNPGEGRFFKIEPDSHSSITVSDTFSNVVFDEIYGINFVTSNNTWITGNSNVKYTTENTNGYILLENSFTVDSGSTFDVVVVEHQSIYEYPSFPLFNLQQAYDNISYNNKSNKTKQELASDNIIPQCYVLYQSYPNPSRRNTTFKYQLPKASIVQLSVYNIAGQLVKQFDMGSQSPGYYSIKWDVSMMANGVYFYKLNAGSYQMVKKMMVLK